VYAESQEGHACCPKHHNLITGKGHGLQLATGEWGHATAPSNKGSAKRGEKKGIFGERTAEIGGSKEQKIKPRRVGEVGRPRVRRDAKLRAAVLP